MLVAHCDMGIDHHKLSTHVVNVVQDRKYILEIEMIENTQKENDIGHPMRADVDVANIHLLKSHLRKPETSSSSYSVLHPLVSGVQCKHLSATQCRFDGINTLATSEIDNFKLVKRYLCEVGSDLHHSSHLDPVGVSYLYSTAATLRAL